MRFTRSESSSEPPSGRTQHLSRKRTLKRGCFIEPLQEKHFKYLWAAYKLGKLDILGLEPDLDPLRFKAWLVKATSEIIGFGGDLFIVGVGMPLGLVVVSLGGPPKAKRQLYPHVVWFAPTTPRNRLECSLKFIVEMKQEGNLIVVADQTNWRFFEHLCKYGCLRAMGKFRGYFESGEDAMLYQGVN